MIKVLFICHGNICRSTMAEFVFTHMVNHAGLADCFHIESAATSREEIGNDTHYGTKRKMKEMGIPTWRRAARQMTKKDYEYYDYILAMESYNLRNIDRIIGSDTGGKVHLLLDYTDRPGDIADPWYTGNFDETYEDVVEGLEGFMEYLKNTGQI
ncbi:MAG: low molecular weight phosphotyrosine protein phosphatase [Lachnospiraceae bacterium]|nr:low molecular weight phosphotyrosine protein phosphatase [Lachnospiraceae bacterium]